MLKIAFFEGYRHGLQKFALGPSGPADDFANNVEQGKDVPPPGAETLPPPGSLEEILSLGNENDASKLAGLPSYLKNMTALKGGMTRATQWPHDPNLIKRIEMHQFGRNVAPHLGDPDRQLGYLAYLAGPRETASGTLNQAKSWMNARANLQGRSLEDLLAGWQGA